MKSAEEILKEYHGFEDVNQGHPIDLLPLTIVDLMEEYADQYKQLYEKEVECVEAIKMTCDNYQVELDKYKELLRKYIGILKIIKMNDVIIHNGNFTPEELQILKELENGNSI